MSAPGRTEAAPGSWQSHVLRVDRMLWLTVDAILLICVAGITASVVLQVVSRVMGASLPWTEELARFLFIWTAFLGMAVGFRRVEHPRVMLLPKYAPIAARALFGQLYALIGIAFFCIVAWYGVLLVRQQFVFGEKSPVLGIGMFLASVPIVMSSILAVTAHLVTVYVDPRTRLRIWSEGLDPQ